MVCLSKSLSGIGLPLALVLIGDGLDRWSPGEHNGTFRGNNAAFVTGSAALEHFWFDDELSAGVERKGKLIADALQELVIGFPGVFVEARGAGMIAGIECVDPARARAIVGASFDRRLVLELAGNRDQVVKLLPPIVVDDGELNEGLERLTAAVTATA